VPLYSEQVFPDRGLRALCMPYLGGTSLGRLMEALAAITPEARRGRDLLDALDRLGATARGADAAPTGALGPFRQYLAGASFAQAACWIAACLADALQYAHDRGLVHMDVKPSNVLIAADGQPMLLDFHLATGPLEPGCPVPPRLGGTPGWTAPEQDAAIRDLTQGRGVTRAVDGRADVYALGLLLYALLGGPAPGSSSTSSRGEPPSRTPRPRLDRCNPQVSTGLADLVHRCLESAPGDRYPNAASLGDDLRRHLNDLPLEGVANRSLAERWAKWRRRRPDALARRSVPVVALAAIVAVGAAVGALYRQRLVSLVSLISDARHAIAQRRYDEAARAAERGLEVVERTPWVKPLERELKAQLRLVTRGRKADELHILAEALRFRVGAGPAAGEDLRSLAPRIRTVWDERAKLEPQETEGLDPGTRQRVEADLLEVALWWASLRVRFAPVGGQDEARREALAVLDQALAAFGPRPALERERRALAEALGLHDGARSTPRPPRTAWEHDDLGRSYMRAGRYAEAEAEFRRAVDLQPDDFWPNFYLGVCAYRLGRFGDALAAFSASVALAPGSAECRVNRALAYERLGRPDDAYLDDTRAAALDPTLTEAHLNRGILSLHAGRADDAIADFRRALNSPSGRQRESLVRYNLALALRAAGDLAGADAEARRAAELGSDDARALLAAPRPRH
jgi:Flp pilus assembly protein TadD